jgi:hypothetical protein
MNATTVIKAVNEIKSYNISVQVTEILNRLQAEAEQDIRTQTAKASGNGNRLKAAERIIKNCKKMQVAKIALHGAWTENDKQYFTDAYQALELCEPLPLEAAPDGNRPPIKKLFDGARTAKGAPVELPTVAELKSYIKIEKAKKPPVIIWDFGENLPAVNAEYLLNILEILPGAVGSSNGLKSPLYFEAKQGAGLLFPVFKH